MQPWPADSEEFEDMLFNQAASSDHLRQLMKLEEEAMERSMRAPRADVLGRQREQVLQSMMGLTNRCQLDQDGWSCAVSLLDSYLASSGHIAHDIQMLPLTCVAVLRLVKKFHGNRGVPDQIGSGMWLSMAKQMLPTLGRQIELSETKLGQHETEILQRMQWQIQEPLQQQWLTVYCRRFSALTSQKFVPAIAWVKQKSMFFVRLLLFVEATSTRNPPREFALGMFCLGLAWRQLLSPECLACLRPDDVPISHWSSALQQLSLPGHVESAPCSLVEALPLLEAATAASRCELQQATRWVVHRLLELRAKHPAMLAALNAS
ncbi:unnamed protein product [Symbiodinium natans]|uniref:Cyclin N-terminal domain-containing protein n=1 Tax=Symbiodinium natans TaxID=878477 RepID=A0A812IHV6_9DINO|nr:unnamed protein product [Symbiodinium natans]